MLSEDEASGYWGPGVFLNLGPDPTNTPHSITSRVAYWAGGIDTMERGEPSIIPIKSLSELSTAVTKAACIQAMHKRGSHDVPLSATVDFAMLKPLIRGAPAILKSHLVAKRDEIKKDTEHNEGLGDNTQTAHKQLPTWADLMHGIVNYSREMGWDDASAEKQNLKPRGGDHKGGTAGHEVKKRVVPGRQLGLPVRKVEAYQWINDNGPYILIPVGPQRQLVKFLIDTGAQISLLTQQDAEKLGVRPRRQRVKITGVNGVSVQCQIAKVNLWLPGEKRMSSTRFAIKDHHENILGFDVLNGRTWRLPNGSVWSFGSNIDPNPSRNREAAVRALRAAPALPESKITNVPQYPLSAAARNGISEVIADLEKRQIISRTHSPYNSPVWPVRKPDGRWRLTVDYRRLNANTAPLTAAVPNIANLTATLQAAAHPWMAALDVKDMFFMVPLKEEDKEKFAFTWEGIQYTFNRLPQGYKHSPTIAHAALAELLQTVSLPQEVKLYQYIDDILIGGTSPEKVGEAAAAVWQALNKAEIEIPPGKCQGPTCGQRTLEWPWSQARVKYTGSMGIHSSKGDLKLSTVVMHGTETYLENEWSWDKDEADDKVPRLRGTAGKEIKIGCRMINGSTHEKAPQISVYNITSNQIAKDTKLCASERLDCWYNFTLVQPVFVVCLWAHHRVGLSFTFKIDITEPNTTTSALSVKDEKILSPQISEVGPYVIKNTGQQQVLFNPSWSLKRVELLVQSNISAIKPTCSPFLGTSYAGWLAWLHGRTLTSPRRTRRDVTGIIGTGLGVLNSIDAKVLVNKLSTTTSDLNKLEHPLRSSLLALGTNQWLLSGILPQWERINERDHQLIVDALGVAQTNVIWDNATKFEKEFQSWWYLANFTYDPINNKATAFVLTIHNASVYTIYPIIALGLNHNGTVLYPLEHRVWAHRNGNKWQTVDVNACVVREQKGFICESNTIKAQDICLDTEQNVCHFEIQPDEAPETVLVYVGKGCVCMRTLCDFIFVDNVTVDTSNRSNICVCNFTKIVGYDFNYSAPVTSYQLLQSNYTLSRDLLPTPIGMNLTLVKKLLQHDDLCQLLEHIRNNGHKTLITVHHDAEEIRHVLERVKKDGEHHWWETLLGWSPTATGVFNLMLHPVVILLTLTLCTLTPSATPMREGWRELGLFSLEKRRLRGILSMEGAKRWIQALVPSDRTRGNGHKRKHRMFCLNIRKHFFTVRVTEHWNRLPRKAMESPSLEIFKSCLDMVLGNRL
ncbi:hypothetical protein QYF61_019791 [Mycteria americana]|uniref:ribonuclease H n=1 Tax=Mycteria americana TaxID=33587 RepID=A0AAN7RPT4_MYCAM|nr:hypothetical protein QYF61_019791 [Mycteria americana]